MARQTKHFDAFGIDYRTRQFSAIEGMEIIESSGIAPTSLLRHTEARVGDEWVSLGDSAGVNLCVIDMAGILPPMRVLRAICSVVNQFSFGFLEGWSGAKVPMRFLSDYVSVPSKHSRPMTSQLVGQSVATLRELEEYYSLEDAFKMFDILVAKGINEALANEAASKDR